ncbi:MAG TPA: DUF6542 domain-containing protein [Streptosporangiaceae bacterium]|jgi:hypothetical protein
MTQSGWYRDDPPAPGSGRRGPADSRPRGRDDDPRGRDRRQPPPRLWGGLPKGIGVCIVIGFAALGALATAGTNTEPGFLLGAFLVVGTLIAGLAVQPRGVYLIIPAPALCYVIAAVMAGLIHDRSTDGSQAVLAVNGTTWIAGGFFAMCIATVLAILLTLMRWFTQGRRQRRDRDDDGYAEDDGWDEPERPSRSQRRASSRNRSSALRD